MANLVVAGFGAAAWLLWNETQHELAAFIAVFAFLNAIMAIMNLLPIGRELPSDGTKLRKALKREDEAETDIDLLRFAQASYMQAHWPQVQDCVLERWMNAPRPQVRAFACQVYMLRELERGNMITIARAYSRLMETAKAQGPQGYAACVTYVAVATLEFIYELCMRDGKIEDAENRAKLLGKWQRFAPRSTALRAQAAIAFRHGKLPEAQRLIRRARREAAGTFEIALRAHELRKVAELGARLELATHVHCEEVVNTQDVRVSAG
jgi:hypothetical protein